MNCTEMYRYIESLYRNIKVHDFSDRSGIDIRQPYVLCRCNR